MKISLTNSVMFNQDGGKVDVKPAIPPPGEYRGYERSQRIGRISNIPSSRVPSSTSDSEETSSPGSPPNHDGEAGDINNSDQTVEAGNMHSREEWVEENENGWITTGHGRKEEHI